MSTSKNDEPLRLNSFYMTCPVCGQVIKGDNYHFVTGVLKGVIETHPVHERC